MAARLTVLLFLCGCGGYGAGGEAYARARTALLEGNLSGAEGAAERAAAIGGPEIAALCDFLRGNAAFARCETAERQAGSAAAEPFALDVAIAYGEKARRLWQRAAMSRDDWPEARRNVERARKKLRELRRKKEEREPPKPKPPRPRPRPPEREAGDPEVDPQRKELTPEQVRRLLERLAEKEREKLALRRERRAARSADVERDW